MSPKNTLFVDRDIFQAKVRNIGKLFERIYIEKFHKGTLSKEVSYSTLKIGFYFSVLKCFHVLNVI